ncbi:MAG TPA: methyltransferase domain-containing protein [Terriglobales bacterium]|nr:methyltransferase domain-containing protein [Terriglobales bacterium]
MPAKVDLYNHAYGNYERDIYREIRVETYGEDLGQTSWVTTQESDDIPRLLELGRQSKVLEIGCGSGRYALRVAEATGCQVVGVDVNPLGIANANALAQMRGLSERVRFEECDVSSKLAFAEEEFDAVFANDVLCHIPERLGLFAEIIRILKAAGQFLFSDALVIGGLISSEELAIRSSIGKYVFSPAGENERLLMAAGFGITGVTDTSADAAKIAKRWYDARKARKAAVLAIEGEPDFSGLQKFLACVYQLTLERRLLRFVYLVQKKNQGS